GRSSSPMTDWPPSNESTSYAALRVGRAAQPRVPQPSAGSHGAYENSVSRVDMTSMARLALREGDRADEGDGLETCHHARHRRRCLQWEHTGSGLPSEAGVTTVVRARTPSAIESLLTPRAGSRARGPALLLESVANR